MSLPLPTHERNIERQDWATLMWFTAGLVWQGYIASTLMLQELTQVDVPMYPGLLLFAGWSALPAVVAAIIAALLGNRTAFRRRFARWFFWLGLPVTAGSILLAV